eukprot:TRINITY_DN253_c0_g1_i10.p1 TRINITY_DN253_c0_g1~~TRINITY_DN253_c0_g1_i10.p1  ORF type:complete len:887 (+),score=221.93 TRINITY_DN253_c0_g1_i10:2878-5538(+)
MSEERQKLTFHSLGKVLKGLKRKAGGLNVKHEQRQYEWAIILKNLSKEQMQCFEEGSLAPHQVDFINALVSNGFIVDVFDVFIKGRPMVLLLLNTPPQRLIHELNLVKLELFCKSGGVGDLSFTPTEDPDSIGSFSPADRLEALNHMLNNIRMVDIFDEGTEKALVFHNVVYRSFPLHDRLANDKLMQGFAGHLFAGEEQLDGLYNHFGAETAWYFAWINHYCKWLILVAVIGIGVGIAENLVSTNTKRILQNCFGLFVSIWTAIYLEYWVRRNNELKHKWSLVGVPDLETLRPDFVGKPRKNKNTGETEYVYSNWKRFFKTFILVPLLLVQWILLYVCIGLLFWWEQYIIMDWAGCSSYPGGCDTAVTTKGFIGFVYENVPGLIEAVGFEVLLLMFEVTVSWVCRWQNHKTQENYEKFFGVQIFLMEFFGVFSWYFMLAFYFVPSFSWESEESCYTGILKDADLECMKVRAGPSLREKMMVGYMITPFLVNQFANVAFKSILPSWVHQCLTAASKDKANICVRCCVPFCSFIALILGYEGVPQKKRSSSDGPKWKPPHQKMQTLLGELVPQPRLRKRNDLDVEGSSVNPLKMSVSGLPDTVTSGNIPAPMMNKMRLDGEDHSVEYRTTQASYVSPPAVTVALSDEAINKQMENAKGCCFPGWMLCCKRYRKVTRKGGTEKVNLERICDESNMWDNEFFQEYLEIVLQFCWVCFFSMIFPWGALCALANNIVEVRSDMYKLTHVNLRPIPKKCTHIGIWMNILRFIAYFAILVNLLMMVISLNSLDVWLNGFENLTENWKESLLIMFGVERAMFAIVTIIRISVQDKPKEVHDKIVNDQKRYRMEYLKAIRQSVEGQTSVRSIHTGDSISHHDMEVDLAVEEIDPR